MAEQLINLMIKNHEIIMMTDNNCDFNYLHKIRKGTFMSLPKSTDFKIMSPCIEI